MATTTDSTQTGKRPGAPKRIIICCDGTWMDSLGKKSYEPPSNVTRISRGLCRTCSDGTHQVINYFAGVGTANALDQFTGGAFGMGLDGDIREVYNFICTNYVDGDDIILIGFSRGAFTARSTADMIASVGLLTPEGLDNFYRIFEDYEHIGNKSRDTDEYLVPGLPEYNGSHGQAKVQWEQDRMEWYKRGLQALKYTRTTFAHSPTTEIRIKALAVWDTVGTLGIPPAPVIGVRGSADQWRFTNTQISDKVENAFQALGLDEPRFAFRPSLWECLPSSGSAIKTNLKQVWFPGSHANIGGGWHDQQLANITLAWMADQLSSVGVEFNFARMSSMFLAGLRYSAAHPFPYAPSSASSRIPSTLGKLLRKSGQPIPWAVEPVFRSPGGAGGKSAARRDEAECDGRDRHPDVSENGDYRGLWGYARPWSLGMIRHPTSVIQTWAGKTVRRPGLAMRVDEDTNEDTGEPLLGTNERIHSSVRVRLACGGLGADDRELWACEGLLKGEDGSPLWKLERVPSTPAPAPSSQPPSIQQHQQQRDKQRDNDQALPLPRELTLSGNEYPAESMYPISPEDSAWQWRWLGKVQGKDRSQVPNETVLPEEPLTGFWERHLLGLLAGEPDVWRYAFRGLPFTSASEKVEGRGDKGKRWSFLDKGGK